MLLRRQHRFGSRRLVSRDFGFLGKSVSCPEIRNLVLLAAFFVTLREGCG
jgi:hypothetical protein